MTETATPIKESRIPSLKSLAADTLQKTNPTLFFRIPAQGMPPEITTQYIEPAIDRLVAQATEEYLEKEAIRQDRVEQCTSALTSNDCFPKVASCTTSTIASGVHVAIYFILQAAEVNPSTRITFLCTVPVTWFVSACAGMCLTRPLARGLANLFTPANPSKITIDLGESGAQPPNNHP